MLTIQERINALAEAGGGRLTLEPGNYVSQGKLLIPSGIWLDGPGPWCCSIAGIQTGNVIGSTDRRYYVGVSGVCVMATPEFSYIGIDFRLTSTSFIRNIHCGNFQYGVLLAQACYYNILDSVTTDAGVEGVEIYDGANQNTLINCKTSGPTAIHIINSNGTTILGGSGEGASPGKFIKQTGECLGTSVKNFRGETTGWGPVWCNDDNLIGNF